MKSAPRVPLVEYPEETRRKLTQAVKDKVFKRNLGFEELDQGSPRHVFFGRPLDHTFIVNCVTAPIIDRILVTVQYVLIVGIRPRRLYGITFNPLLSELQSAFHSDLSDAAE
jgi:hypothetical protein